LFTAGTPNGKKVSIFLEELGVPYSYKSLDFSKNEQKEDWYLKINQNGKIPAIVDHENGDFVVFESGAILIYLAEKYGKFLPTDPKLRSQTIQWVMFQMGGIGPMQGQLGHFSRYASEKIPYAIKRYHDESLRLYSVLDKQLEGKDYIVGVPTIADFCTFPWVNSYEMSGISIDNLPNIQRWLKVMQDRPAVQRGLNIPPKQ